MQKGRLQLKQHTHDDHKHPTLYIRATNGHSRPGPYCPDSLSTRVTTLGREPDDPLYFIRGANWEHIINIMQAGPSCRSEDNPKRRGRRQFVHGCPYLPGDPRILSGLRRDSEVLIFGCMRRMMFHCITAWRSLNDVVRSRGDEGRIHPKYVSQLVGTASGRRGQIHVATLQTGQNHFMKKITSLAGSFPTRRSTLLGWNRPSRVSLVLTR